MHAWDAIISDRTNKLLDELQTKTCYRKLHRARTGRSTCWGILQQYMTACCPYWACERQYPQLDEAFIKNPDRTGDRTTQRRGAERMVEQHQQPASLYISANLQPAEWFEKHSLISVEDFENEPHRNKLSVLT